MHDDRLVTSHLALRPTYAHVTTENPEISCDALPNRDIDSLPLISRLSRVGLSNFGALIGPVSQTRDFARFPPFPRPSGLCLENPPGSREWRLILDYVNRRLFSSTSMLTSRHPDHSPRRVEAPSRARVSACSAGGFVRVPTWTPGHPSDRRDAEDRRGRPILDK